MEDVKKINLNEIKKNTINDKNYRHIYEIELKKNRSYFITLLSNNDCEFNLRLYDKNKKIIKLKDDDNTEDLCIADINKSIDFIDRKKYKELSTDDNEDNEEDSEEVKADEMEDPDEEMLLLNNAQDMLNNMILDIMNSLNPDDINNKIEITIELDDKHNIPTEADIDEFVKKSEINKDININYNNKIYFTAKNTGKYYLSVTSDYYNQEGEFNLLVKEVEDIKFTSNKEIELNSKVFYKSKEKFKSKKFFINLSKDVEYKLNGSKDLKFLISKNKQKIISKCNLVKFNAQYSGKYEVEVMSLKKNTDGFFKITSEEIDKKKVSNIKIFNEELYDNLKERSIDSDDNLDDSYLEIAYLDSWYEETDIVKAKKIILLDENDSEFELFIKNGKLEIKPVKK